MVAKEEEYTKMHLIKAIRDFKKSKQTLFTTPGHSLISGLCPKYEKLIKKSVFACDLSEVNGLDNLQNPEGAILRSCEWAAEIYGSAKSFYLVNGTSSGILALMLATAGENDKVAIARNAHKSVINALILTGAFPVWIDTDWDKHWQIPTGINIEKIKDCHTKNPEIKSLWITSPTYEGVVTDIDPIINFCKEKNITLIVDEAHGALWNFSKELPDSSIKKGADACVQSLHKTGPILTQGAILHLSKNSKIDPQKLQACINMVTTTSPSYNIMASIEGGIHFLNSKKGKEKLQKLLNNIKGLKLNLKNRANVDFLENTEQFKIDSTKIIAGIKGISGHKLADYLENRFNIETEMDNDAGILAITGIGTSEKKLNLLEKGIIKASQTIPAEEKTIPFREYFISPLTVYTPREAFSKNSEKLNAKECVGRISKNTIVNYPPGIPIIIAGEIIQENHLPFINERVYLEVIKD